jgi:LPS sulfotransferase NodH
LNHRFGYFRYRAPFPAMAFVQRIKQQSRLLAARAYSSLPVAGITNPVFILGCGRSGTTIFGTALSKHPRVTYLNEPRHLWRAAFPQSDIWSRRAAARNGTLVLNAADADPRRSQLLRRLFKFETLLSRRPVLIEKLPVNSFRLPLIQAVFPDARFLHIHRNGLEVARSIQRMCQSGLWYGADDYKWKQLSLHAASRDDTKHLPAQCSNSFERGLLEWRLSTEAIVRFLHTLPPGSSLELPYDELVADPVGTLARVLSYIGLPNDDAVTQFVRGNVRRKSAEIETRPLTEKEREIGGPLLPPLMNRPIGITIAA